MAYAQERIGYPRGWLSESSYTLHVELERIDPSAPWQLDDWAADSWDPADTALPE
ncbi:hypothetical protein I6A60_23775 [Frankia sp. AgB1.9]|uniref:hypothetical protein n=1 Tax=unclassified Frankia TaxID=2632575 RepID=UPI001932EB01|nr:MULTISPECIES: hypothetical protein [unclassified Frankia]MBL7490917.1 hypothetical protein [Frankia sp. AgW1.1]MBL7550864.1 hypothetical protein [Frankia sp. AgB1.9]MBL7623194.1 hypothetical protein [Frankia sp. AgB1.8]